MGERWRVPLSAGLVIGLGLWLALAATLAFSTGWVDGSPGATLMVRVPDPVRAAVLLSLIHI